MRPLVTRPESGVAQESTEGLGEWQMTINLTSLIHNCQGRHVILNLILLHAIGSVVCQITTRCIRYSTLYSACHPLKTPQKYDHKHCCR